MGVPPEQKTINVVGKSGQVGIIHFQLCRFITKPTFTYIHEYSKVSLFTKLSLGWRFDNILTLMKDAYKIKFPNFNHENKTFLIPNDNKCTL